MKIILELENEEDLKSLIEHVVSSMKKDGTLKELLEEIMS